MNSLFTKQQHEQHLQQQTKVTFIKKVYKKFEGNDGWFEVIQANNLNNPSIIRLPDPIVTGLYIGDWRDAVNPRVINFLGITHILSIAGVNDYIQYKRLIPRGVELLMFCIDDTETTSISHLIPLALDFIHKGRCTGRVLVHCIAGVSRSAAFCTAYLIQELQISFDNALEMVQKARPLCKPNKGFEVQLRQFEGDLSFVTFSVHFHTKWGETLHLVGNCDVVGNWVPSEKTQMSWVEDGLWEIRIPVWGKPFQYKYLVASSNDEKSFKETETPRGSPCREIVKEEIDPNSNKIIPICWEQGINRNWNGTTANLSRSVKDIWGSCTKFL